INRALQLFPLKDSQWKPKVLLASAYHKQGIDAVWQLISDYIAMTKNNKYFDLQRNNQNIYWMRETIQEQLLQQFYQNEIIESELAKEEQRLKNHEKSPFSAAQDLLTLYKKLQQNKTQPE